MRTKLIIRVPLIMYTCRWSFLCSIILGERWFFIVVIDGVVEHGCFSFFSCNTCMYMYGKDSNCDLVSTVGFQSNVHVYVICVIKMIRNINYHEGRSHFKAGNNFKKTEINPIFYYYIFVF